MHKIRSQGVFRKMSSSKSLSFLRSSILPIFALAFSLPVIIFSLVTTSNSNASSDVSVGITRAAFSLTLSVESSVTLGVNALFNGVMTVDSSTVTVGTNSPYGYRLYLGMNSTSNALIQSLDTSKTILASSGSFESPAALTNGTWGYAIPHSSTAVVSTNGFDNSYEELSSARATNAKFASIPVSSSTAVRIAETDDLGTNDIPVYYGVRVGYETDAGDYTNNVVYTAIADTAPGHTAEVSPEMISNSGGESITVTTPLHTTMADYETHAYLLTAEQYAAVTRAQNPVPVSTYSSQEMTCNKTNLDALQLQCTTVAIAAGNQYGYVDVPHFSEYYATEITVLNLTINVSNTNTTSSAASVQVPYGGSATVTVTPSSGYYLGGVSCPTGYTCTGYTTGSSATGQQTVTITHSDTSTTGGTIAFTGTTRSFDVTISKTNVTTNPTSTVSVPYGGSATVTVTPTSGYYLSSVSCPSGYTCTGYSTSSSSASGQQTITITNNNTMSGGTLTLTGADPWASITQMQQMTTSACTVAPVGKSKTLTDTRDSKTYTVKKLADGKCWMTQNLRLTGSLTLTPANSNVSANWTLPAVEGAFPNSSCVNTAYHVPSNNTTYGNFYNWYAATAGTGTCAMESGNATASICPKGWRLPTGGDSGEFQTLYNNYNSSALMRGDPAFVLPGIRGGSTVLGEDYFGYYWSSTANNSDNAYDLYLDNSNVSPAGNFIKYAGSSVRCVAQ